MESSCVYRSFDNFFHHCVVGIMLIRRSTTCLKKMCFFAYRWSRSSPFVILIWIALYWRTSTSSTFTPRTIYWIVYWSQVHWIYLLLAPIRIVVPKGISSTSTFAFYFDVDVFYCWIVHCCCKMMLSCHNVVMMIPQHCIVEM